MEKQTFIPQEFYCPITGDLMNEPVSDPNGHSYEKKSIHDWLMIEKTSPITREPLNESQLIDNIALKRSIDEIRVMVSKDKLKIDSRISDVKLKPFRDSLGGIELKTYYMDDKLFVNIQTPDIDVRPPVDIVLCIDVSYSMYDPATLKGESNETITHGFSVLSLTIVAAKTILHSLNENDNISVVTYSSEAKTIFENISCTPENKRMIEEGLDSLKPISNTNMWSGIIRSLDILRTTSPLNRVKGVMLLTDGIPNVDPPRGHRYMLEKYFRDHNFRCMVSCYGFGYKLDSILLSELSVVSGGDGYSFIPDASILGSVFINGISNLFTTAVQHPQLKITLSKGVTFEGLKPTCFIRNIGLDSLKYGQDKNIVFNLDTRGASNSSDGLNNFARVELKFGSTTLVTNDNIEPSSEYYINQRYRTETIQLIDRCIEKKKYNDLTFVDELNHSIEQLKKESTNEYIQNIAFDLDGQVKEALNMTTEGQREDWFSRWGKHYLLSLRGAYENEICNNFKDRGVSQFGGELFRRLIDEVSDIFDDQPPPKRDIRQPPPKIGRGARNTESGRNYVVHHAAPTSMRVYNNAGGGCCSEGCRVLMNDQGYKKVEEIRKGDRVITFSLSDGVEIYSESKVECVIRTKCTDGKANMVMIDNLKITPYHPILLFNELKINKKWRFPIDIRGFEVIECNYMYTFVIENRESLLIEGSIFSTYGHYLRDGVVEHDYFGTDNVINDLKRFPGYEQGMVQLTEDSFIRDLKKNQIVAIK
tara:strand:- start:695 stop:2977 length:2283 start_codon:yes stop_codon:yes gene_type:complete